LQEITVFANKRFRKLTNNRLQLELTKDNDFQIRDFMNNGKIRSIKTLSGGAVISGVALACS
jgi:exonuclease SbcC